MVDDVGEVVREEADIEGVHDGAHRGHRDVGLEVLLGVPAEGRHAVVILDSEPAQPADQPPRAIDDLGVSRACCAIVGLGDDCLVRVQPLRVTDQHRDVQWVLLHQPLHVSVLPPFSAFWL